MVPGATDVVESFEHQHHGRIARLLPIRGKARGCGRQVHGLGRRIYRGYQRGVNLPLCQRPAGDLQGANAGKFFAANTEAGAAEVELTVEAIADDVGHGPDDARRAEKRRESVARRRHPVPRRAQRLGPARHAPACPVARDLGVALHAHEDCGSFVRQGRCHLLHRLAGRG